MWESVESDRSTRVGNFVSPPRERGKGDRELVRKKKQRMKENVNDSSEREEYSHASFPCLLQVHQDLTTALPPTGGRLYVLCMVRVKVNMRKDGLCEFGTCQQQRLVQSV